MSTRSKRKASNQQQEEEGGFQGRRAKKMDRYQPSHRRDTRPPLPPLPPPRPMVRRSEGGRSRDRGDGRGGGRDSEVTTLPPWAEPQGRYSNAYHDGTGGGEGYGGSYRGGGSRGGDYRSTDRGESSSRYIGQGDIGYRNPGRGNASYSNEATRGRSMPEYARNPPSSFYNHPNISASSDGGVTLQGQFNGVSGYGQSNSTSTRRDDQWRGQNPPLPYTSGYTSSGRNDHWGSQIPPPPPPIGRLTNFNLPPPPTSYRVESSYPTHQYPEGGRPRSEEYHSRESSRGRAPFRDYPSAPPRQEAPHRSEHRYPPPPTHSSRGPLSSARFRQGIDKHSRYAPPLPPPHNASRNLYASPPLARRGGKKVRPEKANRAKPPINAPTGPRSASPLHTPIPHSKNKLPAPEPSELYLTKSLDLSPRLQAAMVRRQLIILDLNGTLLARKCGRAKSGSMNPTPRPGLAAFLEYIFTHFGVMVWSSAQPDNVRLMVHALFSPIQKKKLLGLWGRDTLGLTKAEFGAKVQVYKRLERVWKGEYQIPFPEIVEEDENGVWDQTNTMLLDDSPVKALGQPYNHIEVPEFQGTRRETKEDRVLIELVGYLEEIRWQGNVSAFMRSEPFKVGRKWGEVGKEVLGEFGWVDQYEKEAAAAVGQGKGRAAVNLGRKGGERDEEGREGRVENPDELELDDLSDYGSTGGVAIPSVESLGFDIKEEMRKKKKKIKKSKKVRKAERAERAEKAKRAESIWGTKGVEEAEGLGAIAVSRDGSGFDKRVENLEAVDISDHEVDHNQKIGKVAF